jgi:hypothetical protein
VGKILNRVDILSMRRLANMILREAPENLLPVNPKEQVALCDLALAGLDAIKKSPIESFNQRIDRELKNWGFSVICTQFQEEGGEPGQGKVTYVKLACAHRESIESPILRSSIIRRVQDITANPEVEIVMVFHDGAGNTLTCKGDKFSETGRIG